MRPLYNEVLGIIHNYSTYSTSVCQIQDGREPTRSKCEWNNYSIKNAHKISRILPDFICKPTHFHLVFNFEQTRTVTIFNPDKKKIINGSESFYVSEQLVGKDTLSSVLRNLNIQEKHEGDYNCIATNNITGWSSKKSKIIELDYRCKWSDQLEVCLEVNPDYCIPRVWKWGGGPDPVFPLSFTTIPHPELLSSLSRIPFSFRFWRIPLPEQRSIPVSRKEIQRFPESRLYFVRISFSFPILHPCPNFGESLFRRSSQIPYPVNVSRIPHCISVKSRSLGIPLQIDPVHAVRRNCHG